MKFQIKLSDVIEAMEKQGDESFAYLDKRTGNIVVVAPAEFAAAEDNEPPEAYPEWLREAIKIARDILDNKENYFSLPSQFDIYEYGMMRKFARSYQDDKISRVLQTALQGSEPFSLFRDNLDIFEISEEWKEYRGEAYRRIAVEWCEKNKINYLEE